MRNYTFGSDEDAIIAVVAGLSTKIVAVKFIKRQVVIETDADLTDPEIASVRSAIGYRAAINKVSIDDAGTPAAATGLGLRASASFTEHKIILATTNWEVVGGVITTGGFFVNDPDRCIVRLIADFKTTGAGAEIRIVESPANGSGDIVVGTLSHPDTVGTWLVNRLDNAIPIRLGTARYIVEARQNTAAAIEMRYSSISILEKI